MRGLAGCVVALVVTGCMSPSGSHPQPSALDAQATGPRVVVGLVDSGINPYHEVFRDPDASLPLDIVDARTGRAPVPLTLSAEGNFSERLEHDARVWAGVEPMTLYWFRGTRVLAVSLLEQGGEPFLYGDLFHGTGTASVVRNVSRDAWIVLVQVPGLPAGGKEEALAGFEKGAAGVNWLAEQPWVDVLSLSLNLEGNPPLPLWGPLVAATKRSVEAGKPVVVAAGNLPSPTVQSGPSGPPWIITVGGAEGSTRGVSPQSGQLVDVVADYTRTIAGREPDEYVRWQGTSFGTPVVAGVLAQALLELRTEAGHAEGAVGAVLCPCLGRAISQGDLRAALNVSAGYFDTADWDPLNYSDDPVQLAAFATAPVLPAPWVQMGWGYVGAETIPRLSAALRGEAPPVKPAEAEQYMAAQQAVRETYWARTGDG